MTSGLFEVIGGLVITLLKSRHVVLRDRSYQSNFNHVPQCMLDKTEGKSFPETESFFLRCEDLG